MTVELGDGVSLRLIELTPGSFLMGSENGIGDPDEHPLHKVTLSTSVWMSSTEVTQDQWSVIMGSNPSFYTGDGNRPVEQVSWDDAQEYCERLEKRTGLKFRLPTEAEWECACRAGSESMFSMGSDPKKLEDVAWFANNSGDRVFDADALREESIRIGLFQRYLEHLFASNLKTHTVASKAPNAWGFFDMHGNVAEWCEDFYDDRYYEVSTGVDPKGPESGPGRVFRGGGFTSGAVGCRAAVRNFIDQRQRGDGVGFRVVAIR